MSEAEKNVAGQFKEINLTDRQIQQFWSKVKKGPKCWEWLGCKTEKGYGKFSRMKAHRIAYTLAKGPIPHGLHVSHHCDNPGCCNPGHLSAVANFQNFAEKVDRNPSGKVRFKWEDICEMRAMFVNGASKRSIARKFKTIPRHVRAIISGKSWKTNWNEAAKWQKDFFDLGNGLV